MYGWPTGKGGGEGGVTFDETEKIRHEIHRGKINSNYLIRN